MNDGRIGKQRTHQHQHTYNVMFGNNHESQLHNCTIARKLQEYINRGEAIRMAGTHEGWRMEGLVSKGYIGISTQIGNNSGLPLKCTQTPVTMLLNSTGVTQLSVTNEW